MQRQSLISILISNIDENTKNILLPRILSRINLKKFKEKEKNKTILTLTDLRDIKSKNSLEVYEILNTMVKNNQYFMYCGPLLININPGPNLVKNYLNLQSWVKETENKEEKEWKPHLYSFMYYVYQTMVNEKKDQIINMLGQIGSGKTFNIIHIIEYYCCMVGPENFQIDTFDIIHKSIQLVHIMGSIFRENNLESTSCGLLLRLGFGNDNKICFFDLESKILDFTLPFSENGRSFSVLHSFVVAASSDLKRNFNIFENNVNLNFFKKFSKNFPKKTKERFKLNDFEIWNKFHVLLKFFDFNKDEVIEILQIFSFMITLNDLGMIKGKINNVNGFIISKGKSTKKLSKLLKIDEDEFIKTMGVFKEVNDIKNTLISLMKYSYYICFEYIIRKIKTKLKLFFNHIYISKNNISQNDNNNNNNIKNQKINSNKNNSNNKLLFDEKEIKYINFIDFPGEVKDQTLGGIMTNFANECLNLYAGNSYSSVVEKLIEEKVFLKLFKPLHSYQVVRALMGNNGLFNYLSNSFTQENYFNLRKDVNNEKYFQKCIKFKDNNNNKLTHDDFKFQFIFSHTIVNYNYESLYLETKSLINVNKTYKIFSISNNNIIKYLYQKIVQTKIDFFQFVQKHILSLFSPIENLSPFVVYCLHSNKSYKIFFGNDKKIKNNQEEKNWLIPKNLTKEMLEKSLCIPVLYWEWYGYHEWINMETFVKEFGESYRNAEIKAKLKLKRKELLNNNSLSSINNKYLSTNISSYGSLPKNKGSNSSLNTGNNNNILNEDEENWKKMNCFEKTHHILNGLFMTKDTIIGKNYVMMKPGTFNKIKERILSLNENKIDENYSVLGSRSVSHKNSLKNISKNIKPNIKINNKENNEHNIQKKLSLKTQCHLQFIQSEENDAKKKKSNNNIYNYNNNNKNNNSIKRINIIDNSNYFISKYNLYKIIDKNNLEYLETKVDNSNLNQIDDTEIEKYRKKNNIVIPDKQNFDLVSGLFNYNKRTNFRIFDYSKVLPEIITIQSTWRSYKSKQKLLLLKYVISQIIKIQSFKRGFNTRRKFNKLKNCLKKVLLIQKIFRKRYRKVINAIIKIQSLYRKIKGKERVNRKLKRLNNYYEKGEEYYDSSDEEIKKQIEKREKNRLKLELKKKQAEERNKKRKNLNKDYIKPIQKQKSVPKKNNNKFDLTKEKNKSNIISAILLDKNLMKENKSMNRLLANEKGVNKNIKYELLQIVPNQKKNRKNSNQKIEDSLIEYGEILKQKKAKETLNKLKSEEMKYSFHPKVNKNNNPYMKTINTNDFLVRAALFEARKEEKIEQIKTTIIDPDKDEYTFTPKLSYLAKNMKRNINDLYKWKHNKDLKLENKIKEKTLKEIEETEKNSNLSHVNDYSKHLLTKMNSKGKIKFNRCSSMGLINNNNIDKYLNKNNDDDEIQLDLWPEEIDRKFYNNKDNNKDNNNQIIESDEDDEENDQFI